MRWDYMDKCESLFDKYKIKPLLGVIPINRDPELLKYPKNEKFWERVIIEGSINNADFRMAKEILNNYNVITDCFSKASNFALMAKDSIGIFDNSKEKQRLINLADVVAYRKN